MHEADHQASAKEQNTDRERTDRMKTEKQYNRLLFIFIPTVMIFLAVFVWGLGLFTDIEEEPYVSEETNRIVVGELHTVSTSTLR